MKYEVELPIGDSSTLSIAVGPNGWSQCFLIADGQKVSLGAEAISILAMRLARNLGNRSNKIAGHHQGYELHYVIALSETYNTLYCAFDQEDRILFWQDKWAKWFWCGKLTQKNYDDWCGKLEKLFFRIICENTS